jgi:hypothetical protein
VNYAAMRWAVEDCRLDGAAKPILFVIAYRGDRETGYCWAGQRRIAKEAGVTRTHVQRIMAELLELGVLEKGEPGSGTRADTVRIAPGVVEHEAGGRGGAEATTSVTRTVEGQAAAGEVIHNPASSGHMTWPQPSSVDELVATLSGASGHIGNDSSGLVATSADASGHMLNGRLTGLTSAKAGMSESQGLKQVSLKASEDHVLDVADSTADAVGSVEARDPPPVDPSIVRELRRRGLGLKPVDERPPGDAGPTRTRDEQLAELKRRFAADFKGGQERDGVHVHAVAQPATIELVAGVAVAVATAETATVAAAAQDATVVVEPRAATG